MLVKDIMTHSPAVAQLSTSIQDAIRLMREYNARHLPVLDDEKLIGVISDRDLTFLYGIDDIFENVSQEDIQQILTQSITTILKTRFLVDNDVITTHPESPIIDAIRLIIDNRISSLPVTDPTTGRLVGIITPVDILDAAAPLLSR